MVVQRICNAKVEGSSPFPGTNQERLFCDVRNQLYDQLIDQVVLRFQIWHRLRTQELTQEDLRLQLWHLLRNQEL
jgi:hypothetical protein